MNDWIALIIGYGFAIVIGHFRIKKIVDGLWRTEAGWNGIADNAVRPASYLSTFVGVVERVLFVASLQMEKAEFIGVWLVLKVASQWKLWSEGVTEKQPIDGRIFYNIFLIGSGLSIAYAVVGAQIIHFIAAENWSFAIGLPVALLAGTVALHMLAVYYQPKLKSK